MRKPCRLFCRTHSLAWADREPSHPYLQPVEPLENRQPPIGRCRFGLGMAGQKITVQMLRRYRQQIMRRPIFFQPLRKQLQVASVSFQRISRQTILKPYGIAKFVGGYVAAMNGVDAIVFTAGIGENVGQLRKDVCNYFGYLGVEIDDKANDTFSEEIVISTPNSKVKVAVIPTNEELAICRDTVALVK